MIGPILGGAVGIQFSADRTTITGVGNSLMYGESFAPGRTLLTQIREIAPIRSQITPLNLGIDGQRTSQMIASPSAVSAAYQSGKTNILLVWEGVNDMLGGGLSPQQAYVNMRNYCQARLASNPDNPWRIVLLNLAPVYLGDQSSQDGVNNRNAQFEEFNALIRDNQTAIGYEALVDLRQSGSPFILPNYDRENFKASTYKRYFYIEANDKMLHFNALGYSVIAPMVAATLRRLPRRRTV